jgi:hypothetical protein
MLGVLANDTDNPVPLNHLAFVANRFHTGSDFHPLLLKSAWAPLRYLNTGVKPASGFQNPAKFIGGTTFY